MTIRGRVVCLGDGVDTDMILPGAYLNLTDARALGEHLLETYPGDPGRRIRPGDIVVAGTNFGMGSSREHAQVAFLARGVRAIVAESFARIFLRNCINTGLTAIECPAAVAIARDDETLTIDLEAGRISSGRGEAAFPRQPSFIGHIVEAGGLINWTRERVATERKDDP